MGKISLYKRRRRLITVLYERQSDTIGNLAFEFSVSSHTIRNDIRVLELEYPIYTDGRGWRCAYSGFKPIAAMLADITPTRIVDGCMRCSR